MAAASRCLTKVKGTMLSMVSCRLRRSCENKVGHMGAAAHRSPTYISRPGTEHQEYPLMTLREREVVLMAGSARLRGAYGVSSSL